MNSEEKNHGMGPADILRIEESFPEAPILNYCNALYLVLGTIDGRKYIWLPEGTILPYREHPLPYKPLSINELNPDFPDWTVGAMEFVDSETDCVLTHLVFAKTDIWTDSLDFIHEITFPKFTVIPFREQPL